MLSALAAAHLLSCAAVNAAAPMPAEIASYYRDYNFVSAFSSPAERLVLARRTTAPRDRRLASVAAALARLAGRTQEELDPGIVYKGAEVARPHQESAFSAGIVQVTSWRVEHATGEAWIDVEVLQLDEDVGGRLVAEFDRLTGGGERVPEADQLIAFTRRPPVRTLKRHHWRRIHGAWQLQWPVWTFTRY
jgi:hypothetical protein